MQRTKMKNRTILPFVLIVYLILSELLGSKIVINNVFSYADEIVSVVLFFVVIFSFLKNKQKLENVKNIVLILITFAVGILGNCFYGLQQSKIAIVLDIVACSKLFIAYFGFYQLLTTADINLICKKLNKPAKLFLILALVFGLLSLVVNTGMRGQYRYGLYGYNFIFSYAHTFSMMIIVAVQIISISEKNEYIVFRYTIVCAILMVLTLKGPSFIWAASTILLFLYFRKHDTIKLRIVVLLTILAVLLGTYQIQTYFFDHNSPRYLLYENSIKVANTFFPFGSGFATFGSDMAAKYYSSLYYQLGFSSLWGMSPNDTKFLNDNYWPLILGQFGWIGLFMFLYLFYSIYKRICILTRGIRPINHAVTLSSFIYVVVHSIGSSTPTTSTTLIVFVFIVAQMIISSESNMIKKQKDVCDIRI